MAVLFRDFFYKEYKASWCSSTALFVVVFLIIAIVLPLILVTKTHGKFYILFENNNL